MLYSVNLAVGAAGTIIRGILSLLDSFCPLAAIAADFVVGLTALLDGFCPDAPDCAFVRVRFSVLSLCIRVYSYQVFEYHLNGLLEARLYRAPAV